MPGLQIIITNAGRAALVNAEHNGTAPLKITEIGITAAVFTAGKETTALPGEIKRLSTISGEVVAPDTIHVTIRDDGADTYTVRGIGYWLSNGVLLGVYSQPDPILQKSTQSMMLLAADVVFTDIKATSLTFGDTNFTNPPATVERQGVVELATPAETVAGTDGTRAVTPAGLVPAMAKTIADHTAAADPHPQYLTPDRGNALYFRKLPAYSNSDTNCDTLLETGVRDVSVANDRGVIAATKLPMGADGYGTLTTENGGQFVHQVYTEGGIAQRTWERTAYLGATTPFEGRPWKLIWNSGNFAPGDYVKRSGDTMDGPLSIAAATASASYATPSLEIREARRATDVNGRDISCAPRLSFHWGSVCVTQMRLTAGNVLEVVGGDGAIYGSMQVGSINATSSMTLGGKPVWHQGNFDPSSKQDTLGYRPPQAVGNWLNSVIIADYRATAPVPNERAQGVYFDFRNNDAGNLADGGLQHGAITFRPWGTGDDFSGGSAHQLGFTANGNLFHRTGKGDTWEKYRRLLKAGQNGTLPDNDMPIIDDCNNAPLGWATYTQEKTANRPSAYGQLFSASLTGNASPTAGNWVLQRALSTDNQIYTRVNTGGGAGGWSAWALLWGNNNFNPSSKATGAGYNMQWSGRDGQPTWLIGGEAPGTIYVYNPSNFDVRSARSAGTSTNAENVSNGNSYMRLAWSDPGGQPVYLWGSDGPTAARLAVIGNLNVGHAREADNATKVGGVPLRFAENPGEQPYYVYGVVAGRVELTLFNRSSMAVGSAVNASYANQLSGQGLGYGGVGGYVLNKNKSGTGLTGNWEQRGQVYDFGSGAAEGNESSAVLWQRVA